MSYDSQNIFARILRGDLPAHKIYEDGDTFAFMDIMPRADGHALVIPKTPARNVLDADPGQLAACMRTVQRIAAAQVKVFAARGITIQQFNEPAGIEGTCWEARGNDVHVASTGDGLWGEN